MLYRTTKNFSYFLFFQTKTATKTKKTGKKKGQVDINKAEEEMAKKRPLLLHITYQARLVLLHSKRHRPLPALRKT
jgi:hypothetical protein